MGSPTQAGTDNQPALCEGGAPARPVSALCLQALSAQDPLLTKWQLRHEFPPPSEQAWRQHELRQEEQAAESGRLRLHARHESGEIWECHVPFADLAREGGMIIGQCPRAADIVLPHESVSHRHARLEIAEAGLVVTDLFSTHGTSVNEQKVTPYDRRVPLSHGSSLLLGQASLQLEYIH